MFGMGVRERHVREKGDKEGCSRYGEKERGVGTFQGGKKKIFSDVNVKTGICGKSFGFSLSNSITLYTY